LPGAPAARAAEVKKLIKNIKDNINLSTFFSSFLVPFSLSLFLFFQQLAQRTKQEVCPLPSIIKINRQ
jgi:hypothetical protein